jgi:hypothetical protein
MTCEGLHNLNYSFQTPSTHTTSKPSGSFESLIVSRRSSIQWVTMIPSSDIFLSSVMSEGRILCNDVLLAAAGRWRRAKSVGTFATKAAANSSIEPQVFRLTWLVPFPYIGRRAIATAISRKPIEKRPMSERRLWRTLCETRAMNKAMVTYCLRDVFILISHGIGRMMSRISVTMFRVTNTINWTSALGHLPRIVVRPCL